MWIFHCSVSLPEGSISDVFFDLKYFPHFLVVFLDILQDCLAASYDEVTKVRCHFLGCLPLASTKPKPSNRWTYWKYMLTFCGENSLQTWRLSLFLLVILSTMGWCFHHEKPPCGRNMFVFFSKHRGHANPSRWIRPVNSTIPPRRWIFNQ